MNVLMMFMKGDRWLNPGHDDICEVDDVARAVSELGVSVTVVGAGVRVERESEVWNRKQEEKGIRFWPAPPLGVVPLARTFQLPLIPMLQANLSALTVIEDRWRRGDRFDVIHCFGWKAGLAAGLLAEMMDVPVMATMSDVLADRSPWLHDTSEAYSRYVWRWLFRRCKAILCPDEQMKAKVQDLFLSSERDLIVLPPHMSLVNTRVNGRPKNRDEKNIILAGTSNHLTGLTSLIRGCARMTDGRKKQLRIFLCSPDPPGRSSALVGLIRRSGLVEQIYLLKPRASVNWWTEILSIADLLFLPDPVAFIGNVVLRAVVMGVPVLAVQCVAMRSLFADICREMTYPQEHEEMLPLLLEAHLFDEQIRARLVAQERRISQTWQPVGPRLLSLYQQIGGEGQTGQRKGGEPDEIRISTPGGGGGLRE